MVVVLVAMTLVFELINSFYTHNITTKMHLAQNCLIPVSYSYPRMPGEECVWGEMMEELILQQKNYQIIH